MIKLRVCRVCLKEKPVREFRDGRRVCNECYGALARNRQSAQTGFADTAASPFTCKVCKRRFRKGKKSSTATGVCRSCHRENLLRRKAEAPAVLTCSHCGKEKPKGQFEKYSLTRCKACAAKASKEYYQEKKRRANYGK